MVRIEALREAVICTAEGLRDPEVLDAVLKERIGLEREELEGQRAKLDGALVALGAEVSRLLEAHARWRTIGVQEFDEAMTEAAARKRELEDALLRVNVALDELPEPEKRMEQLRTLATDIEAVLDHPDPREVNAWLAKRIRAIWCEGREVKRVELL